AGSQHARNAREMEEKQFWQPHEGEWNLFQVPWGVKAISVFGYSKFIRTLSRQPAKGGRITKSNLLIHVSYLSLKSLLVYLLAA
ncbi:MAG TPA: hypothetical protein VEW05_06180, partial [Candidatus Polarisedimenticolia bacterium]|nr:hypothetical protein [Candidatus Polarisedimenticolia bacterium]